MHKRARESENPGLPPPGLATRRHVCVHVVYLAGSELCEMGEMGVYTGGYWSCPQGRTTSHLPVTREHRCARSDGRRSDSPPRVLVGVHDHHRKSRDRGIYNELQLDISCDLLAYFARSILFARYSHGIRTISSTLYEWRVRASLFHAFSRTIVNDAIVTGEDRVIETLYLAWDNFLFSVIEVLYRNTGLVRWFKGKRHHGHRLRLLADNSHIRGNVPSRVEWLGGIVKHH